MAQTCSCVSFNFLTWLVFKSILLFWRKKSRSWIVYFNVICLFPEKAQILGEHFFCHIHFEFSLNWTQQISGCLESKSLLIFSTVRNFIPHTTQRYPYPMPSIPTYCTLCYIHLRWYFYHVLPFLVHLCRDFQACYTWTSPK